MKKSKTAYNYFVIIQEQKEQDGKWENLFYFLSDKKFNILDSKEQKKFNREWKKVSKKENFRVFKIKWSVPTLISRDTIIPEDPIEKKTNKKEQLTFSNGDRVLLDFFNGKPFQCGTSSEGIVHYSGLFKPDEHSIYLKENLKVGEGINRSLLKETISPAKKSKK